MKKVFPVIVVLIALSVAGIVAIQISWLNNLMVIQKDKYNFKIQTASVQVSQELSKQISGPLTRMPYSSSHMLPQDFNFTMRQQSIASRYSTNEIYNKLRTAMKKAGLHNVPFEFAITSNGTEGILEMQSKNFLDVYLDSSHIMTVRTSILPENYNMLDGPAYENIYIVVPNIDAVIRKSLLWVMITSIAFTAIVIAAFFLTVKTIINQRNLNKIKSDFINNMTHELKTPLATISLAVDALQNSKVQTNLEKSTYFSGIIKEENKRMNKHVETILQAALMDKNELKLNFIPLHAHSIIEKVVNNFTLQLNEKNGKATMRLNAANDLISADETHFTNLINNLVDNAVKYSKESLQLTITTHSSVKYLVIQIEDNGIGMSKETVKRVFEKFYRAHTGNVHNVKGFGLGMSYVKQVIDAHKGKIKVESILGKGSTFTVEVPLFKENED